MDISNLPRILIILLLALGHTACAQMLEERESKALASDQELSIEEQNLARDLTESSLKVSNLFEEPIYFIGAELHRVKQDDGTSSIERHAVVSHFRYEGNLTILTYVNLSREKIVEVESVANVPARLSVEEFEIAKGLALSDPKVKKQLGADRDGIVVEPLVSHSASPEDPMFGRRVVRLLFRIGRDYLSEPIVLVDLTDRKFIIEE